MNPIQDARIAFRSCIVSGALISILKNEASDILCCGPLVREAGTKNAKDYCVFKAVNRKTNVYMMEYETKIVDQAGEQGGGFSISDLKLVELTKDLERPARASRSTLRFNTHWDYSEGGTTVRGKLPGQRTFGDTLIHLNSVDEELEQFAAEFR